MKRLILAVSVLLFATSIYGYRLNRVAESGARWKQFPVSMTLNPYESNLTPDVTQEAIAKAMDSWNTGLGLEVLEIGAIDRGLSSSEGMDPDAVNAIVFSKNFTADTGFDVSTTVAVGGQYGDGSSMSSAFVVFNAQKVGWYTDEAKCAIGYSYCDDLETIALHEFGHVLGLGHSEVNDAVMNSNRTIKIKRELHKDDIEGGNYVSQYGAAGGSAGYNYDDEGTTGGSGGAGGCGTISTGSGSSGGGMGGTLAVMLLPLLALGVLRNRIALQTNR